MYFFRNGATHADNCTVPICKQGTMLDVVSKKCKACPKGFYQDKAQQTVCLQCPQDTSTESIGAISKDDCVNRYVEKNLDFRFLEYFKSI